MIGHEDLALVRALSRHGSIRRAAADLGQHVATAYRRLGALERSVGQTLFERKGGRLAPTDAGLDIVAAAEAVDGALADLRRRLEDRSERLSGEVAITTTDTLLPILVRALPAFSREHPEVRLRLAVSNRMADLGRGEAMIAFRPTATPPETLIGVKVADFGFAAYAAANAAPGWISLDRSLASIPAAVWLADHHDLSGALQVNSLWAAAHAAQAGLGRALLPDYLGALFALERLSPSPPELRSAAWLLYHPQNRRNLRIRRFVRDVAPVLREAMRNIGGSD